MMENTAIHGPAEENHTPEEYQQQSVEMDDICKDEEETTEECCYFMRFYFGKVSAISMGLVTSILTMCIGVSLLIVARLSISSKSIPQDFSSQEYMSFLRDLVLPAGSLLLPESSVYRALQWMVVEDPLRPFSLAESDLLQQRFALATFYYDFSGNRWNLAPQDGWLKAISTVHSPVSSTGHEGSRSTHECDWLGIQCDAQKRVVAIELYGGENPIFLTGTLSSSIGQLSSMQFLHLVNHPGLKGTPPIELGSLTMLEELNLSFNDLSSFNFSTLGNLSQLRTLSLSDNNMEGTVTNDLTKLTNLEQLVLSTNPHLQGEVFSMLSTFTKAKQIVISVTSFGGTLPSRLGKLTDLQEFYGSNSKFVGSIPPSIGQCSMLETFFMRGSATFGFSGSIPSEIGLLSNLKFLDVSENLNLNSTLPTQIGLMTNLQDIAAYGNDLLHGTIPTEFGALSRLTKLRLYATKLSGTVPVELAQMSSLVEMDITQTRLQGTIPDEICDIETLRFLDLDCRGQYALFEPCRCCQCFST